jgi:hypothetical protein
MLSGIRKPSSNRQPQVGFKLLLELSRLVKNLSEAHVTPPSTHPPGRPCGTGGGDIAGQSRRG